MPTRQAPALVKSILPIIILMAGLSGCNFTPPTETPDPGFVNTAAAETIQVSLQQRTIEALEQQLTSQAQTIQAPTLPPAATEAPISTDTPVLPSATLMPTLPLATLPPPTLQAPMLTADVDTRCRQGPSTTFATLSYILVGQQAEVLGRNPERTWWLIRDPRGQYGNCWAWGETTRLLGDERLVPIIQSPPTPTTLAQVNFNAAYANIHNCGGVATVVFQVSNTGTIGFQSSSITIRDMTNNVGLAGPESSNVPFMSNQNACPPGFANLPGGATGFVAKGMGLLPPSGTKGRGIIVLCTKPDLAGECLEMKANFTFP